MIFSEWDRDTIARAMEEEMNAPRMPLPVEADGASHAARMILELF